MYRFTFCNIIKIMKITVLVENNSRIDNYLLSEAGLSLYLEINNRKILFDTGYSGVFLDNAEKLGIKLDDITDIVISHGHDDHTRGLGVNHGVNLGNKSTRFTAHPNIFDKRFDYSCPISKEEIEIRYETNLTKKPYKLDENLWFLGEIENNNTIDIDDSALVYTAQEGLFIITGCSHSGIINIINYAKKVTGVNKLYGVFGGMHLIDKTQKEIEEISEYLKSELGELPVYPCHCCDLESKIIMSKYLNIKEICTGDIIEVM